MIRPGNDPTPSSSHDTNAIYSFLERIKSTGICGMPQVPSNQSGVGVWQSYQLIFGGLRTMLGSSFKFDSQSCFLGHR